MKAMILAAGLGTRMGPLTGDRAKPSLELFDLPLIRYPLALFQKTGIRDFVVNVHHYPESLRPALRWAERDLSVRIEVSEERERLMGTAGGLKKAGSLLSGETGVPFLLANSDSLYWGDIEALTDAHIRRGALATLAVRSCPAGMDYGPLKLMRDGRVLSIAGKPVSGNQVAISETRTMMFAGIHVIDPEVLDVIPSGEVLDINTSVYPGLIADGRDIRGYDTGGEWLDFGTPSLFLSSALALLRDLAAGTGRFPLPVTLRGTVVGMKPSDWTVRIPDADDSTGQPTIDPGRPGSICGGESRCRCAYLGPGSAVHPSSRFEESSLGAGSVVDQRAELNQCIVMAGASIGNGVQLDRCLVGPDTVVPDGLSAGVSLISGQGETFRLEKLD